MINERTRPERLAFMEGVCWVTSHIFETARRVAPDQRGIVEVDGKAPIEAILKSGNPAFASHLMRLAELIEVAGHSESKKRFPDFDPLPPAKKAGESCGF